MASGASAPPVAQLRRRLVSAVQLTRWLPQWSPAAAVRAVRAAIVMPAVFVIADKVIGNLQVALFAAFGSFATLVLVSFAGTAREKLTAHLALALAGSVLLTIGTAVSSSTVLAALVTVPVAFAVFFAGVAGPNAATGVTGALLLYVLPAATPGTSAMIPDRLAGWWLASIVGTAAILLFPTPSAENPLRAGASRLTGALADQVDAMLAGEATDALLQACIDAKYALLAQFNATPFRPTGLGLPALALADAVELLEWCTSLIADSARERSDLSDAAATERELLEAAGLVLRASGALFVGRRRRPELEQLEQLRRQSSAQLLDLSPDDDDFRAAAQLAFHAHAVAVTALAIGADAMLAAHLVTPEWIAEARSRWFGDPLLATGARRLERVHRYGGVAARHASLRSVWFVNSMRVAVALAAAVAVAGASNVQHGFWVVLGALSVLRTSASATGATAIRAIVGTVAGFVIGGALLLVLGKGSGVLWAVLPLAVLVAAYAPGTAPFAVGQAAFTVTVALLFNLLAPVGWKVGELRVEDVAIGCAVSVVVGALFWPRGVAALVGDDLADAYRAGAAYLRQAVDWVAGPRAPEPTDGAAAVTAGLRLDEALRGFLAERGTKHLAHQDLWRLVGGTLRLRLTAVAIAGLQRGCAHADLQSSASLARHAEGLEHWFGQLAESIDKPQGPAVIALAVPPPEPSTSDGQPVSRQTVWLDEHLDHLTEHLDELVAPAAHFAAVRRRPWWR